MEREEGTAEAHGVGDAGRRVALHEERVAERFELGEREGALPSSVPDGDHQRVVGVEAGHDG